MNYSKIALVTILCLFGFLTTKAQLNFICECEAQETNELYCLLENAGYISVEAVISSTEQYSNTNCPCDNFPALMNNPNPENSSPISGTTVEIMGKEFIIEDVFDDYETYFNGTTNINIYNLSEFCPDLESILDGPGNVADFNLNVVLIDHEGDECDVLYYKSVFNDPCGFGFTTIDRSDFPIPDYTKGILKFGDVIYYSYTENKFRIASSPPNPSYTVLENTSSIVLEINSYISDAYDGPPGPIQICGEKIISYVEIIPIYQPDLDGYVYSLNSQYKIGQTGNVPVLEGRNYFEGLPNIKLEEFGVENFSGCFEQHASVPLFEEFGLYVLGYDIVNVAQKAQIEILGNQIEVKFLTDIFPSADFILYGEGNFFIPGQNSRELEIYEQPSFEDTHCFIRMPDCSSPPPPSGTPTPCPILNISKRPNPMFYCRFPEE